MCIRDRIYSVTAALRLTRKRFDYEVHFYSVIRLWIERIAFRSTLYGCVVGYFRVDGWFDEWMSGWMKRCLNGWIKGWLNEWMVGWVNCLLYRAMDKCRVMLNGWKVSLVDNWLIMNGWFVGWMDDSLNRWLVGWLVCMAGSFAEWLINWVCGIFLGWLNGLVVGWMDGRLLNGWVGG